jgi:hypothetical protein
MRHLSCNKIRSKATDFCQDLLTSEEADRVRIHLAQCPSCRKEYRDTEDTLARLPQDRIKDPGPEFWDGLQAAIMHRIAQNRPAPSEAPWYKKVWEIPFQWPGSAWATALILLAIAPVLFYAVYPGSGRLTSGRETVLSELRPDGGPESLTTEVQVLTAQESAQLEKRLVARLAREWMGQAAPRREENWSWDEAGSLEQLNQNELEAVAKKLAIPNPTG